MNHINVHMLVAVGACPEHAKLFRKTFGVGEVPLTEATVLKALEVRLDVFWLARFLDDAARAELAEVEDAALAEYYKVEGPARAQYYKVAGLAEVEDAAEAVYWKVRDAAWAERDKVCALALIRLL